MSQTQSIIVYRNPAEQAMWESGLVVPIFSSLFVGVFVFAVIMIGAEKLSKKIYWKFNTSIQITSAVLALASVVASFHWMTT